MARARRAALATRRSFDLAGARLLAYAKSMDVATPRAVRLIGEEVMTDVKASRPGAGVPRDTGNLANTGRVTGPNQHGEVTLSFGGPAAAYAVVQHERLDFRHEKGEARYLVRGLERWQPDQSAGIAALRANAQAGAAAVGRAA